MSDLENYLLSTYEVIRHTGGTLKTGADSPYSYRQKKIAILIFLFLLFINCHAHVDSSKENLPRKFKFSGFIRYDVFADARQTVNAREGLVVLYPANVSPDENGNDINAKNSLNMLSIHSRLRCNIAGPVLLGAESGGVVEADFYGNENQSFSDLNGLRLFNAYLELDWGNTELMAGQFWHPMSIPGFFPGTVAFSAGAPFHPMSRNPQIRLIQSMGKLKLIGSLLSQRDFTGTGPDGPGSQYLRNSGIPNIHIQVQYGEDCVVKAGAGIDYKKIVPELFTENSAGEIFATGKSLSSLSFMGFVTAKTERITIKTQGVYGQNVYDLLMLGGYAVKDVINVQTGKKDFTNINTASLWADVQTNGDQFFVGFFCGYSKNIGAKEKITGPFYARGSNIGNVYRIAPRVLYGNQTLTVSLEGELTAVWYGIENGDTKGGVTNTSTVSNFRALLSFKYSF